MISYQFIKDKKIWTVTSTGEDSLGVTCETGETASMTSDEILRLPTPEQFYQTEVSEEEYQYLYDVA